MEGLISSFIPEAQTAHMVAKSCWLGSMLILPLSGSVGSRRWAGTCEGGCCFASALHEAAPPINSTAAQNMAVRRTYPAMSAPTLFAEKTRDKFNPTRKRFGTLHLVHGCREASSPLSIYRRLALPSRNPAATLFSRIPATTLSSSGSGARLAPWPNGNQFAGKNLRRGKFLPVRNQPGKKSWASRNLPPARNRIE